MLPLLIGLYTTTYYSLEYPDWFLEMPVGEEEFFVVGYSAKYHYLSSSIEKARQVAKQKIATHIRDSISGQRAFSLSPVGKTYISETINEVFDTSVIKNIEVSLIDSAILDNMVIVLATSGKGEYISFPLVKDTSWIMDIPEIPGWILESGSAPIYEHECNSWLAAERDARVSLAMAIKYHLEDLKKYDEISVRGVSIETVNSVITGVHTIARYINKREGYCKVLMGIRR
jgi:hypothetical protein